MKSIFEEIGFDRANRLMADATAKAARETAALGLPDIVKLGRAWCVRLPDGHVLPLSAYLAFEDASVND